MKKLPLSPSIVYGHFLSRAGYSALTAAKLINVPCVLAVGEHSFWSIRPIGLARARRHFGQVSGVIALSSVIRDSLIQELHIPESKIIVAPNGIDLKKFFKRTRSEMCLKYGIPLNTFNIAFVGSFDERKGSERLLRATAGLSGVRLIMVGKGPQRARADHVAFQGVVSHDAVPELLSCADMFVLPTTGEGSCNAVLEAMACGLPIVTSDGPYMDDIVDAKVALRVDPLDTGAIRAAIQRIMNNPAEAWQMSKACVEKAKGFAIDLRAKRIMEWMGEAVRNEEHQRP